MGNVLCQNCALNEQEEVFNISTDYSFEMRKAKVKRPRFFFARKLELIQQFFRMKLAIKKLKNKRCEVFEKEYQPNYANVSEIHDRRGEILPLIERSYGAYNSLPPSSYDKTKAFEQAPIYINDVDKDIYEGTWVSKPNIKEKFSREGYGCVYKSDGTKIEAFWKENKPIGTVRIYYNNG